MIKTLRTVALVLVALLAAMATTTTTATAHHEPLMDGKYVAEDIVDGSALTLWVVGGDEKLGLYDEAGSVCITHGPGFVPALHYGELVQQRDGSFDVTGHVYCLGARGWVVVIDDLTINYAYDADAHMFKDSSSQTYELAG